MQGTRRSSTNPVSRKANVALWTTQGLLALVFLFAGAMKLIVPVEEMSGPVTLPALFIHFIGVCEVAGALGLVLPGIFRFRTGLTPLAAAGLVVIMVGATTLTAAYIGLASAVFPLIVGILAAVVAYGRRPRATESGPAYSTFLQPAS
jgi:hypothetical protein